MPNEYASASFACVNEKVAQSTISGAFHGFDLGRIILSSAD